MYRMYWLIALCSVLTASPLFAADKEVQLFSQMPIVESPQISPDGSNIAAIFNTAEGPQVVMMPFGTRQYQPLAQLKKARDRVENVSWSGNRYIIVTTSYPEYFQGRHFRVKRLYRIDVTNGETKEIANKIFAKKTWYQYQSYILRHTLPKDEHHILVSTYAESDKGYTLYQVDLRDNTFVKTFVNKYDLNSFTVDHQGKVRIGTQVEKKGDKFEKTIWYRANPADEMKPLHKMIVGTNNTFDVMALNEQGDKAYVVSDHKTGRQSLWLYDIATGNFETMIFGHDKYDVYGTLHDNQYQVIGVRYIDDFSRSAYFSEKDAAQEKMISELLPQYQTRIVSSSTDKTRLLAYSLSDVAAPTYFSVDLVNKKVQPWLATYPQLLKTPMNPVNSYTFTASDGVELSGYLTLPAGKEAPPLVVYPHGGPHSRDSRSFDPMIQFLTQQGYAVLQVNFRGSEGFGSQFETSGYQQWGKRMQQDVYEAMDHILASGAVSKDKACVLGFSYGGYVALTSSFQQPKRFDCIISVSGIADLRELVEDEEREEFYLENIVDIADAKAVKALDEVSAIHQIDKIKSHILLIHGTKDTQVSYQQSAEFYDAAKKRIDVEYLEIKDGTHYFDNADSNRQLYENIDKFLSRYLQ
jgi:dipeptidyl aminopeptidase/acylaminoacyl peptidase